MRTSGSATLPTCSVTTPARWRHPSVTKDAASQSIRRNHPISSPETGVAPGVQTQSSSTVAPAIEARSGVLTRSCRKTVLNVGMSVTHCMSAPGRSKDAVSSRSVVIPERRASRTSAAVGEPPAMRAPVREWMMSATSTPIGRAACLSACLIIGHPSHLESDAVVRYECMRRRRPHLVTRLKRDGSRARAGDARGLRAHWLSSEGCGFRSCGRWWWYGRGEGDGRCRCVFAVGPAEG